MIVTSPSELAGIHKFLQPYVPQQHQKRIIRSLTQDSTDMETDINSECASSVEIINNLHAALSGISTK